MSNRLRQRLPVILIFAIASFFFVWQNVVETYSVHRDVVSSASCFSARENAVHVVDHLSGPFINVGMPKMGSTSLHKVKLVTHTYIIFTVSQVLYSLFVCKNSTSAVEITHLHTGNVVEAKGCARIV